MRRDFLEYLERVGALPRAQVESAFALGNRSLEPIGSIAYRHGMLSSQEVEHILEEQRHSTRKFGEIARDCGILTARELDTLLELQRVRWAMELAESLALSGVCATDEVIPHLARFLTQHYESLATSASDARSG